MIMKIKYPSYICIVLLFFLLKINFTSFANTDVQDDTVMAYETKTPPKIDGVGDDSCWALAKWQNIDQTWIPYGAAVDTSDFKGVVIQNKPAVFFG